MTKVLRPVLMDCEAIRLLRDYKKKQGIRRMGDAVRKLLGLETPKRDESLEKIEKELNELLNQGDETGEGDTKDESVKSDDPVYPPI